MDIKIFVTCGNTHDETFENVCHAVNLTIGKIEIIHIFDTEASAAKAETTGRTTKIRKIFGNIDVRTSQVNEDTIQKTIPEKMSIILREFGRDKILVDLSNGQKITSSVLYAVATISRIENIYVLESRVDWRKLPPETRLPDLKYKEEWDYISIQPLKEILNISQSSFVELIYYRDKINDVTAQIRIKNELFGNDTKNRLDHSLIDYFTSATLENESESERLERCISGLGKICEEVSMFWHNHCRQTGKIRTLASDFNGRVKQIIKHWDEFRRQLSNRNLLADDSLVKETVVPTLTADIMLDCIRIYRNLASHPGNPYKFSRNDARFVLDSTLLILERISNSNILNNIIVDEFENNEKS